MACLPNVVKGWPPDAPFVAGYEPHLLDVDDIFLEVGILAPLVRVTLDGGAAHRVDGLDDQLAHRVADEDQRALVDGLGKLLLDERHEVANQRRAPERFELARAYGRAGLANVADEIDIHDSSS